MDALGEVLAVSGVRGVLGARIEAGQEWGVRWGHTATAAFYAVTAGTAWLTLPDREPLQLLPGDVVLLPSGCAHSLSGTLDATIALCDEAAAEQARREGGVLRVGFGPTRTQVLAAAFQHDPAVLTQVLCLLPEVVHLPSDHGGSCLGDTVRLLARELAHPQLGATVVLGSLVDILLVQLLRVWLGRDAAGLEPSLLGVLRDPLLAAAVTAIHAEPGRAWTTEALAADLSVSRATLSRRFLAVAGMSPGGYLTQWRMDLAARRLRDTDDPLEVIAHEVGYTSVYAFSRAFSRARDLSPGRFRRAARSGSLTALGGQAAAVSA